MSNAFNWNSAIHVNDGRKLNNNLYVVNAITCSRAILVAPIIISILFYAMLFIFRQAFGAVDLILNEVICRRGIDILQQQIQVKICWYRRPAKLEMSRQLSLISRTKMRKIQSLIGKVISAMWMSVHVVPVPKVNSPTKNDHLWPISLISTAKKILESFAGRWI